MPQRSYTNADLARFERKPLGITIEQQQPEDIQFPDLPDYGPNGVLGPVDPRKAIAGAHEALDRANRFTESITPNEPDAATLERSQRSPSVMDSFSERLAKIGRDFKARHDYAMSQPAEQALGALAEGIATPLAFTGYGPAMVGQSALNLGRRGTEGITEHPIATALDVGMLATPALRGLKSYVNGAQAAEGAAESARYANQVERDLVDTYAANDLAKGSQKRPSTILRSAHEKAGRIRGEQTLNSQQLHPDYPDLPEDVVKGIEARKIAKRQPAVAELGTKPANSFQGLLDAVNAGEPDVASFAQGGPIMRGQGGPQTPEMKSLFERYLQRGESVPSRENMAAKINMERPRTTTNASGESMASQEALNRQSSMKAKGQQFVVIGRDGKVRPLIGPEAVDYTPRPGEKYGVQGPNGFKLLQEGSATQRIGGRR